MTLPLDIARCMSGAACPLRDTCRRWIERGNGRVMFAPEPGPYCGHYIGREIK